MSSSLSSTNAGVEVEVASGGAITIGAGTIDIEAGGAGTIDVGAGGALTIDVEAGGAGTIDIEAGGAGTIDVGASLCTMYACYTSISFSKKECINP